MRETLMQRITCRVDDVGRCIEIRFPNLEVNNVAAHLPPALAPSPILRRRSRCRDAPYAWRAEVREAYHNGTTRIMRGLQFVSAPSLLGLSLQGPCTRIQRGLIRCSPTSFGEDLSLARLCFAMALLHCEFASRKSQAEASADQCSSTKNINLEMRS